MPLPICPDCNDVMLPYVDDVPEETFYLCPQCQPVACSRRHPKGDQRIEARARLFGEKPQLILVHLMRCSTGCGNRLLLDAGTLQEMRTTNQPVQCPFCDEMEPMETESHGVCQLRLTGELIPAEVPREE